MFNLERYEFSADDNAWEKLEAKLGNWCVRTEEIAEDKHQVKRQKLRNKFFKAKAKADAAEEAYYSRMAAKASERISSYESAKKRVLDLS